MSQARYIIGDTRDVTASLPDGSVDLVLTSPPFLALRSYLPADHPDKAREIGSEATPAEFLQVLLELAAEWRRVLAPHGSIAVELGDTYSGSGGAGGDYLPGGLREGQAGFTGSAAKARDVDEIRAAAAAAHWRAKNRQRDEWPLAKSLCGIPHLFHLSLAYGRNLLTGEESPAGQWRVRNVVAWCRPNPPVGALGDKYRPATSYMTIACPSGSRYFDLDAVRTPLTAPDKVQANGGHRRAPERGGERETNDVIVQNAPGAPPLDWWEVPTQPFRGAHYATWPEALCDRPILSMVPPKVCTTCGEPSRRITDVTYEAGSATGTTGARRDQNEPDGRTNGTGFVGKPKAERVAETTGWTDCNCPGPDKWRRGIVLDPFAGSGTTLKVATHHGRDAIGIDLDARNADLARERVGLFLSVEHFDAKAGAA